MYINILYDIICLYIVVMRLCNDGISVTEKRSLGLL